MLSHIVLWRLISGFPAVHAMCNRIRGNVELRLVRGVAVGTVVPCVSSFFTPRLVICKKHVPAHGLVSSMVYLWVLFQTLSMFWILFWSFAEQGLKTCPLARMRSRLLGLALGSITVILEWWSV